MEKSDEEINNIRHTYDKLITTHLHNKIDIDVLKYSFWKVMLIR